MYLPFPCNQSMKLNFTKTAGCNDFIENANVKNGYGFKQIMCSIILKYNVTFKILNMLVGLVFRARLIWSHHGFSRSSDKIGGCSFFPSVTNHVEMKRVVYTTLLHGQNTDKS